MKLVNNIAKLQQLVTGMTSKRIFSPQLKILSKYKCKINNRKYNLILNEKYLLVQGENATYKLSCNEIKKVAIEEKLWSIRVKLQCKHKTYKFDFPSFKVATRFYEQLIYSKVKAHMH